MQSSKKDRRGFTLIELLVAMVIIAILAAVALPSYQESVLKAKRAEGRAALMRTMQQQERYYSQKTSYIAFSSDSIDENAQKFRWFSGDNAASSAYEISAMACDGKDIRDCVKLTAWPGTQKVSRNHRDPVCGNLVLTSEGEKSAGADHCW